MEDEKKRITEKIRDKKEDFSNWKNKRFDPWYKHTFKPTVKRAKKNAKRGIKNAVKSYREHKNERLKRKYSRPDDYNINIKNIETIEKFNVGGNHQKHFDGIPQNNRLCAPNIEPSRINYKEPQIPPHINRLTYQPNHHRKPNLDLEKLADWYEKIQNLYNSGYYSEVIAQSNKFIEYFLSRLAEYLNIYYSSVADFLYRVNEKRYQFQFYEEFNEYSQYATIKTHKIGESAYLLFKIISKIIRRLYKIAGTSY